MRIGVLHPGEMGVTVAGAARAAGAEVLWASEGRGAATRRRAAEGDFRDAGSLRALVEASDVIVSVCPPHAALGLAREVAGIGFAGVYVDANAVSPNTARAIGDAVSAAGARPVDGGIIGPPARRAGTTRLYLSGAAAGEAAELFAGSSLAAIPIGTRVGAASALKMCYAAWTKGSAALLLNIRALAAAEEVEDTLLAEWELSQPGVAKRSERAAADNAFKAWRFEGEMREIAASFGAAGLPDGFHEAAAEVYARLAAFKDRDPSPSLAEVVASLLDSRGAETGE